MAKPLPPPPPTFNGPVVKKIAFFAASLIRSLHSLILAPTSPYGQNKDENFSSILQSIPLSRPVVS